MRIRVYDNNGHSNIVSPGLQYIKNGRFNDTLDKRFQIGLALRYNIVGNPDLFSKSYPPGYKFEKISINLGYTHVIYSQLAVNVSSLKNNDNITLDKLIFAIDYFFK